MSVSVYDECIAIAEGHKKLGMYRISGSSWLDIRPFFNIRFRLRFQQKNCKLPDIWTTCFTYLILKVAAAILMKFKLVSNKSKV